MNRRVCGPGKAKRNQPRMLLQECWALQDELETGSSGSLQQQQAAGDSGLASMEPSFSGPLTCSSSKLTKMMSFSGPRVAQGLGSLRVVGGVWALQQQLVCVGWLEGLVGEGRW